MNIKVPLDSLKDFVHKRNFEGDKFDQLSLKDFGVFIIKRFFKLNYINKLSRYYLDSDLSGVEHHPTRIDVVDTELMDLVLNDELLALIKENFYDGNVAANNPLIFRKDASNRQKVIAHNDLDYQMGWSERYSLFIPVTEANEFNGGLKLWPGTNNFGSLGDAGEINTSILPPDYPTLQTCLTPGDLLIMNSAVWHSSDANISGKDRVYFELKIQHADDPAGGKLICGKRKSAWRLDVPAESLFLNSRVQRLRAFYGINK